MMYLANGHPAFLTAEAEAQQYNCQTLAPKQAQWPGLLIPEQTDPTLEWLRLRIAQRWGKEIVLPKNQTRVKVKYPKSIFHYVLFADSNYVDMHWLWPGGMRNGSPIVPFKGNSYHAAKAIFLLSRRMPPSLVLLQFRKQCGEARCVNPHHYLIFDTHLTKPTYGRHLEILDQVREYATLPKEEEPIEQVEEVEEEASEPWPDTAETKEEKEDRLLKRYLSYNANQLEILKMAAGGEEYIAQMEELKLRKLLLEAEDLPEPNLPNKSHQGIE